MASEVLRIVVVGETPTNSFEFLDQLHPLYQNDRALLGMQYCIFDPQQNPFNSLLHFKNVIFRLEDIERFISLYSNYIGIANGCIILFNLNDQESLERVQFWISHLRSINHDCPIIMVGNHLGEQFSRGISIRKCLEFAVAHNVYYLDNTLLINQEIIDTFDLIITHHALPVTLCTKIRDSFHGSPMELTLKILRDEPLSLEEMQLLCHFGGFRERTLLESKFPLEHEILTQLNQNIAVPIPHSSIFL